VHPAEAMARIILVAGTLIAAATVGFLATNDANSKQHLNVPSLRRHLRCFGFNLNCGGGASTGNYGTGTALDKDTVGASTGNYGTGTNTFNNVDTGTASLVTPAQRAPSEAALAIKRAFFRNRMNTRKFRRKIRGRDYTYEYSIDEYNSNVGRNGGREIQPFSNLDYTDVSVEDGIVYPRGHNSVVFLFSKINRMLRNAMKRPEQLGNFSFKYSRQNGLPRYIYVEHDGKVLKVSARNLSISS